MRTDDIKKLIKAEYRIIHEQDYPNYMILEYSAKHDCWEIHSTYPNKEQRNEVLSALLQDEKIILD